MDRARGARDQTRQARSALAGEWHGVARKALVVWVKLFKTLRGLRRLDILPKIHARRASIDAQGYRQ
jgi:hypothetical protein